MDVNLSSSNFSSFHLPVCGTQAQKFVSRMVEQIRSYPNEEMFSSARVARKGSFAACGAGSTSPAGGEGRNIWVFSLILIIAAYQKACAFCLAWSVCKVCGISP